jgi:hypothetical protein
MIKISPDKRIFYSFIIAIMLDMLQRCWHAFAYRHAVKPELALLAVTVNGLTGMAIFCSSRFYDDQYATRVLHLIGVATVLYACSAGFTYFPDTILKSLFLALGVVIEAAALYACIRYLRKPRTTD